MALIILLMFIAIIALPSIVWLYALVDATINAFKSIGIKVVWILTLCFFPPVPTPKPQENDQATTKACDQCGTGVEEKVAYYCRINKAKFNGKILCRDCQQPTVKASQPQPTTEAESKKGSCESCNTSVDGKVVYFCRMNKKKFDGKILCRDCQQKHSI